MCNKLSNVNLPDEQKEKIKDIKETYYKNFIIEISNFNELYKRQIIIDKLDKIINYEKNKYL